MIIVVFALIVLTAVVALMVVLRVQAKMSKMVGGVIRETEFTMEMLPLPSDYGQESVATLEELRAEEVSKMAEKMRAVTSFEQVKPKGLESICFIHVFDDADATALAHKLYSLTRYIRTPYSSGATTSLCCDIVVIHITTENDYCLPLIKRLLLLNNRTYLRLFFLCRDTTNKLHTSFAPFANQISSFHLPFVTYTSIDHATTPSTTTHTIYYGASDNYEPHALYVEPNDENVIFLELKSKVTK